MEMHFLHSPLPVVGTVTHLICQLGIIMDEKIV